MNLETNARVLRIKLFKTLYPPYWDDGMIFYPKYRRGYKNPNKYIQSYQIRMYKTWKHNRKQQWKRKTHVNKLE